MSTTWQVEAIVGTQARTTEGFRGISTFIKALASQVQVRMDQHLAERRTRQRLVQLDDRILRDIGLNAEEWRSADLRGVAEGLSSMFGSERR